MLHTSCRSFPGNLRRKGEEERRGNGAVGGIFGRDPMGLCKGCASVNVGRRRGKRGTYFRSSGVNRK